MKNSIRTGAVTAATIAGVAGVLVLNPTGEAAISAAGTATRDSTVTTDDATTGEEESDSGAETTTPAPAVTTPAPSVTTPAPAATATYTGDVYTTPYGPMQVEATIQDGVIVDITWISLPSDHRSQRINEYAAPTLVEEALAAQSAQVDTISGATWTTEGFRYSLQSILDQAGL